MRLGLGSGVLVGLLGSFCLIGLMGIATTSIKVMMDVHTQVDRDSRRAEEVVAACEHESPHAQQECARRVLAVADTHMLRQQMAKMELEGSLEFMSHETDWVIWAFASFDVFERALKLRYREYAFTRAMHMFDGRLRLMGAGTA
jgi:hypothetical protein